MVEIYILNENLERVGLIDYYSSLIWAKRWCEIGDCEIYVIANNETLSLLRKGYYVQKADDDMICRIEKIELQTDTESGNMIIATGTDAKNILDQRVIWKTINYTGTLGGYIWKIVNDNAMNPTGQDGSLQPYRKLPIEYVDAESLDDPIDEQTTYSGVGTKIQEILSKYKYGFKAILTPNKKIGIVCQKGIDKSSTVIFSPDFENLISTDYISDSTNYKNVALVAGEGEGSERARNVSGYAEQTDRYEVYVDAKDISKTITWQDLHTLYPTTDEGGHGSIQMRGTAVVYVLDVLNIYIIDADQLYQLQINYPDGQVVTIDGKQYYQTYNVIIADLPRAAIEEGDSVVLRSIIYEVYLLSRGYEKLGEYQVATSFAGSVEPDVTFRYKIDYNLGDYVTVKNEYEIEFVAQIVEIIETYDENGYKVEPKFEYSTEVN